MRFHLTISALILAACCILAPAQASAGLVFGPAARTQFEGFRDGLTADTFINFNSLAGGTHLSTQFAPQGVTFSSNIGTIGETSFGPYYVYVSMEGGRVGTIVGVPCDGCGDDGRVGYQIVFTTPQRRAGLLRNWNTQTKTQFYNQSGQLLAEHVNTVGSEFVGFIADGADSATQWVKRIQIDTAAPSNARQVGYSDDLFFGSAAAPFTPALVTGFNLIGNGFTAVLDVAALFGNHDSPVSGITDRIDAVWGWNAATLKWRFFSPQLTTAQNATYAAANNYEVLANVPAGEGYWVNSYQTFSLPPQTGAPFNYASASFGARPPYWNLLAIDSTLTPQQFNCNIGATPAMVPPCPANFESLWMWDPVLYKWYFYSPGLEQPGAPFSNCGYSAQQGLFCFGGPIYCPAIFPPPPGCPGFEKLIEPGVGFWVFRP